MSHAQSAPAAHLSLVLHSHLPFVRHPENPFHLEESWFFEAMHETYLPLLQMFERLDAQGLPGRLTVSLSAPLITMMADALLLERFEGRMEQLLELARLELGRRQGEEATEPVARFYVERFAELLAYFRQGLGRDVLGAFRRARDSGRVELITCVGTHPILPFLATDGARRAHVESACALFERHFGARPRGIWLAECAFAEGMDRFLAESGIMFTFVESSGVEHASSPPVFGNYAPIISEHHVAFFGRDQLASAQVWSASEGYPGDFDYREFYRDLGYDLPMDIVAPYIHPDGIRMNTGLKFHRITGKVELGDKQPYRPQLARQRASEHARHFIAQRQEQVRQVAEVLGTRPAHITCPYDAELFGHWWFEGPWFLEALFHAAHETPGVTLSTPFDYLKAVPVQQTATPAISTWGEGAYFGVWLDESNAHIYRYLRDAEMLLIEATHRHLGQGGQQERALRQAGRELLLAQASDWPFILKTGTAVEYATSRLHAHLSHLDALCRQLEQGEVDEAFLASLEARHNIFPDIDMSLWLAGDRFLG